MPIMPPAPVLRERMTASLPSSGATEYSPISAKRRDQCQDTASRFLGQCRRTDWIGLCRAMLDRPVGTYGDNVQWAASGGHPSNRANAPPLAPSTYNRNPCWGCSNDGN